MIALIVQSKPPKRKDIARRELDIVFYDISLFNTLYLTQSLRTTTDLKNSLSDTVVSDRRGNNRIVHSHLVKEECLSHITHINLTFCQRIDDICIIKINLIHLTQTTDAPRIVS